MCFWFQQLPYNENGHLPWAWTSAGNPDLRCSCYHGEQSWTPGKCRPLSQSKCDLTAFHQTGLLRWCQSVTMNGSSITKCGTKLAVSIQQFGPIQSQTAEFNMLFYDPSVTNAKIIQLQNTADTK